MFEKITYIDPSREDIHLREKHPKIELSDKEWVEKIHNQYHGKPIQIIEGEPELVYIEPDLSKVDQNKLKKAQKICSETKIINIKERKNEKSTRKTSKKIPKKTNSKSNISTVA